MTVRSVTYAIALDADFEPVPQKLVSPIPGFTNWRWIVVSNYSPYIAALSNIDDTLVNVPSLQPFQANRYKFTNARGAVTVAWTNPTPTGDAPGGHGYITVEFSDDPSGNELPGSYPSSLPVGTVINTGTVEITGPIVISNIEAGTIFSGPEESLIASGVTGADPGTGWVRPPLAVPDGVNTMVLIIGPFSGLLATAFAFGDITEAVQIISFPNRLPPGTLFPQASGISFPFAVFPFIDNTVTINFPAGVPINTPYWITGSNDYYVQSVNVEGTVDLSAGTTVNNRPVRSDGLSYPVGAHSAFASFTTTFLGNLIPATAGKRILLATLYLTPPDVMDPAGSGEVDVAVVRNGTSVRTLTAYGAGSATYPPSIVNKPIPAAGMLLDTNTAVAYSSTALPTTGAWNLYADYDLV